MAVKLTRNDILTIPNAISAFGFLLVLIGSFLLHTWTGLALVVIGRTADLLDGILARRTGVTSRFGAALDATLDKLSGLAIIIALGYFGMAPTWALAAIVTQNLLSGIATMLAARAHPGRKLLPSRSGKYAMALQNIALGSFALAYFLDHPDAILSIWLFIFACIATIAGVVIFGLWATIDYFRRISD